MESSYLINVLLIGGRGNIGAGLRTYLPRIDDKYDVTSIDLPGSADKAGDKVPGDLIDLDINEHPEQLAQLMQGRDMVVYLARRSPLAAMNTMTDLVFEALSQQSPMPLVVASSSVHACDGAYSVDEDPWSTWAERRFDDLDPKPQQILSSIDACPNTVNWLASFMVCCHWALVPMTSRSLRTSLEPSTRTVFPSSDRRNWFFASRRQFNPTCPLAKIAVKSDSSSASR